MEWPACGVVHLVITNRVLSKAAHRQMDRLPYSHTFRGRSHETLIELAEKLVSIAPGQMSKVFFANSGSEATDTAIKIAWYYNHARGRPGKCKIIARHGGYHGSTIAAAGLSGHDPPTPKLQPTVAMGVVCRVSALLSLCTTKRNRRGFCFTSSG